MVCEKLDLVRRATTGDDDALVALLERHGPAVRRRVRGMLPARWRSLVSVDDVLQQTYLDAFQRIDRVEPRGEPAFRMWLSAIARRNLIDLIRGLARDKREGTRRRLTFHRGDGTHAGIGALLGDGGVTGSKHAARCEAGRALSHCLEALPPLYRQVLDLYDLREQPIEEVARVMQRTPGAVYMLRARAVRALADLMGTRSKFFSDG